MGLFDALGAGKVARVEHETWGHLAAESGRKYPVVIWFAHAGYGGDIVVLRSELGDLEDSPWLYDVMTSYVEEYVMSHDETDGRVFRFEGRFRAESRPDGPFGVPEHGGSLEGRVTEVVLA